MEQSREPAGCYLRKQHVCVHQTVPAPVQSGPSPYGASMNLLADRLTDPSIWDPQFPTVRMIDVLTTVPVLKVFSSI